MLKVQGSVPSVFPQVPLDSAQHRLSIIRVRPCSYRRKKNAFREALLRSSSSPPWRTGTSAGHPPCSRRTGFSALRSRGYRLGLAFKFSVRPSSIDVQRTPARDDLSRLKLPACATEMLQWRSQSIDFPCVLRHRRLWHLLAYPGK